MLDSLKKEAQKRKEEKEELKRKVAEEKQRLEERREKAKKNIFRKKIKIVDKISTSHEEKRDEARLAEFTSKQTEIVEEERRKRRNQGIKNNKGKIIIASAIVLALVIGIPVVVHTIHKSNLKSQYEAAVTSILAEDYEKADAELTNLEYEDSKSLLSYVKVQEDIGSYIGKAKEFYNDIVVITNITNSDVADQMRAVRDEVDKAAESQSNINSINTENILTLKKESLEKIEADIADIKERYRSLVDDKRLKKVSAALDEIENQTAVGKAMLAIYDIGTVSLNDESKTKIDKARKLYNDLSAEEKELVFGLATLQTAESKYAELKETKELEEAEQARIKKEEEEQAKAEEEERQARLNYTVYLTPTGDKYHFDGCRFLTTKARQLTQGQAIKEGYGPCGECSSWATRP